MSKPVLTIIVLSYNTKSLLHDCLTSLAKVTTEVDFEVIVPDNGSTDGSVELVKKEFPWVKKVLKLGKNLGFACGNNQARKYSSGKYILFLNSDTVVPKNSLKQMVAYMDKNSSVGAATCKVVLPNGDLDKDTRRSFITPWIGFTHLILKLDRILPRSKIFAKYWYGYISEDTTHEVDAIQGAFFLTRKSLLDQVGWFDESYFLDAEDIDLCWKIKNAGYKIIYYPRVQITHIKGASKGKVESPTKQKKSLREKLRYRTAGVNSMYTFYRKHLWQSYPLPLNILVVTGIYFLKIVRVIRTVFWG